MIWVGTCLLNNPKHSLTQFFQQSLSGACEMRLATFLVTFILPKLFLVNGVLFVSQHSIVFIIENALYSILL